MQRIAMLLGAMSVWLAFGAGPAGAAASRFEVHGHVLSAHESETLLADPHGRSDSTAVAGGLARLVGALQDEGYLDARARAERVSADTTDQRWRVFVTEGERRRLIELRVEVGGATDSLLVTNALGLKAGGWVSPRALGDAVEHALDTAASRGYPYASLGVTALDWDTAGARARVGGALGPLVTVTGMRFDGLTTTSPALVRRTAGPLEGRPYDPTAAEEAADRLRQLGLFRTVTFTGLESSGDWSKGVLVYKIEEPHYNAFEGAVGLQGPSGAREVVGLARIELGNLAGTGRSAALHWRSDGPGLQSFDARYREPMVLGQPWSLELALSEDLQDTLYTRSRAGAKLAMRLEPRRRLELSYEQERVVSTIGDASQATTQMTGAAIESDHRDDPVLPRRGLRGRVEGGQWFKTSELRVGGTSHAHLTTGHVVLEWHRPLGRGAMPHAGLAWELSGAGVFSSEPVLQDYERYLIGGTATLRGYDEQQFHVDRYALSRLEWRWFLGVRGQQVHLFWDHAEMGTRQPLLPSGTQLVHQAADGVGFGIRIETGTGLAGIDYAVPPGQPPLDGKIHLQLVSYF
jgi:outer membrane protein assembly factor BamA